MEVAFDPKIINLEQKDEFKKSDSIYLPYTEVLLGCAPPSTLCLL